MKKLRFKSLLDNNFFFAVKPGFADIFKLLENVFLNLAPTSIQQQLESDVKFSSDDSTVAAFGSLITNKPSNKNKYKTII